MLTSTEAGQMELPLLDEVTRLTFKKSSTLRNISIACFVVLFCLQVHMNLMENIENHCSDVSWNMTL